MVYPFLIIEDLKVKPFSDVTIITSEKGYSLQTIIVMNNIIINFNYYEVT